MYWIFRREITANEMLFSKCYIDNNEGKFLTFHFPFIDGICIEINNCIAIDCYSRYQWQWSYDREESDRYSLSDWTEIVDSFFMSSINENNSIEWLYKCMHSWIFWLIIEQGDIFHWYDTLNVSCHSQHIISAKILKDTHIHMYIRKHLRRASFIRRSFFFFF